MTRATLSLWLLTLVVLVACQSAGPPGGTLPGNAVAGPPPTDVRQFVHQTFVHAVPYEQATHFNATAVPTLLAMLSDPAEEPFWANIATTLGAIGDAQTVEPLIAFIERGSGRLSRDAYTGRTAALMGLGYVVNRSGDQRALRYLREGANPQAWATRNLAWASPYATTPEERNQQLAEIAILGLALSGKPEAAQTLRAIQGQPRAEGDRASARRADLAAQALAEHDIIARDGLVRYYQRAGTVGGK